MPTNWPELTLALALAVAAAYILSDVVARGVERMLRAIIPDQQESRLVDRPRRVMRLLTFLLAAVALAFPVLRWVGYGTTDGPEPEAIAQWGLNSGLRIAGIALGAYIVTRLGRAAARRFEHEVSQGTGLDVLERAKRAQTLGRLLQSTLTVGVLAMAGLMILDEFGVDIRPVLTGAGILGLAVGFGAQTLVRDIISGFFLIVEDQVRVGDVAVVNGTGGLVEAINLRTIVLRDEEGTVHVFPNGEVKTLANKTKDFSYYVIEIGVAYDEDPDHTAAALHQIAATLSQDATFRPHILEPLQVMGVDTFGDGRMTLKARIKTVPLKQWEVGRELRRRIAREFKARGISIAIPQRALLIRSEGSGGAERSKGAEGPVQKVQRD